MYPPLGTRLSANYKLLTSRATSNLFVFRTEAHFDWPKRENFNERVNPLATFR